ncbi:hypothetical protein B0I35DRAFT_424966 [Stachybotrys elegans]|uniref:Zn(2)-C6 fungal-type domain-containing protein n=1 Tax=Stachybotrys elegans TaxID=80388 RepID=A0A8K0WVT2_9HYPO|nr:hypothetical protein B0I35DRAFT_424966 [Stachybotrys elegans]
MSSHQTPGGRAGGACSICRAKKRKCSGEKPICKQCAHANVRCEWPEQLKRGLPKNYVRNLEARLSRTETLLKQVLRHISDGELERCLNDMASEADQEGLAEEGLVYSDTWQHNPLQAVQDVRAWQQESRKPHAERTRASRSRQDTAVPTQTSSGELEGVPDETDASALSQSRKDEHASDPASDEQTGGNLGRNAETRKPCGSEGGLIPLDFQKRFLW